LLGERGEQDVAARGKTEQTLESPSGGARRDLVWAAATAVALIVCAAGLFVAGFFTQDLLNNDDGGGAAVANPNPAGGTPSAQPTAQASPTPLPVIQVSTDDAPTWGPEDAGVTILEFSDYQ
jgi:hypothetical protein